MVKTRKEFQMNNRDNRVKVTFPNGEVRTRYCQTTVKPTKSGKGHITNINDWYMYLAFKLDTFYGANARSNAELNVVLLLQEANDIISLHQK